MENGTLDIIEFSEGPVPIRSIEISPKSIDKKPDAIRINLTTPEETRVYGNLNETSV